MNQPSHFLNKSLGLFLFHVEVFCEQVTWITVGLDPFIQLSAYALLLQLPCKKVTSLTALLSTWSMIGNFILTPIDSTIFFVYIISWIQIVAATTSASVTERSHSFLHFALCSHWAALLIKT
jgi:hypothetical protein